MKRYDLNLLTALDALMHERSVSGAARLMGIGQPAMSAALSRLRALFGDPILVRSGSRMEPTPRALELADPLRETLARLALLIAPGTAFDPSCSQRTFRISGGDYVGMTLLPSLSARIAAGAARVDLRFRYLEKDAAIRAVEDDALDLALCVNDALPARFESEILIEETFVGAARAGHPILIGPMDMARYAACDHLLVTERGDARGCVDDVLAGAGLARRIAMTVPSAALVADILAVTDLVATIPRRAGDRIAAGGAIALFEPPIESPGWAMRTIWAARNARDPALAWLRGELRAVAETLHCG